jgi:hypothetical protein
MSVPPPPPPILSKQVNSSSGTKEANEDADNGAETTSALSAELAEATAAALAAVASENEGMISDDDDDDDDNEDNDDDDNNDDDDDDDSLELMKSKLTAYRLQVNDLDRQLLKAQSEASINAELESRARKRQLALEKEVAECRTEINTLKVTTGASATVGGGGNNTTNSTNTNTKSRNMGPAFGATAELVVRLREENTSLRQELQRALEAAKVAAGAAKAAQQPGGKQKGDIDALEYAMHRDEQMSKLTTKNFELFHQVDQRLEEVAMAEAKYENSRREVRKKRARIRDLHSMLKKERNRRLSAENENDKLHDKVTSLTKHIEKLMSALRVQAHERSRRQEETRKEGHKSAKMKRKMKLTRNKSFLSERVIVQLRQQVEMLTGQLRLADDRFTDLRATLDMERRTNVSLQKKAKRRMKSLQQQEEMLSDHIAQQRRIMEAKQQDINKKQTIESKRLKRMQDKLDQEKSEMLILQEAGGGTRQRNEDPSSDGGEFGDKADMDLPAMSFSPTRVEMYERNINTPPPQRGSMMAYSSSLPDLPSPASHSSPFGLRAEAKSKKLGQRKDAMRQQRQKNREKERRSNDLHFWREQEEQDD